MWTTEEILADKELWEVTDSSGDSDSIEENDAKGGRGHQTKSSFAKSQGRNTATEPTSPPPKQSRYNAYDRNKDYYEND